jgi:hypothetical protein
MAGISPNFFPPPDSSGEMPAEEAMKKVIFRIYAIYKRRMIKQEYYNKRFMLKYQ